MQISKRAAIALLTTVGLAASGAAITLADEPETVLNSSLAASGSVTGPILNGVHPSIGHWHINSGSVLVRTNGKLDVEIRGLTKEDGNSGAVTSVSASLYCDGEKTPAATTATAPFDKSHGADIHADVTLPASCLAPVVLIHPGPFTGLYIAGSGFSE
jgi:hypothetical protein